MDKEDKKRTSPISEYMKIRRYALTLIYRNEGKSVQLPTILELSRRFGVSAPTVNKALKALAEDGYIICKRGIGSFTNPNMHKGLASPLLKPLPLIGVLFGDGMPVHFGAYQARILSTLLEEITALPSIVHMTSLSARDPDAALKEIENERLDGLIWYKPPQQMSAVCKSLAEKRRPLVVMDSDIEGASSVSFDVVDAAFRCGRILAAEGRRNIVFFPDQPPWSVQADGLRKAYREAGVPLNEKLFLKDTWTLHEKLREMISLGVKIDAVFGQMMLQNEVEDCLLQLDPKICESCAVVNASLSLPAHNPFRRLSFDYPFAEFAKEVAAQLSLQLNGKFDFEPKKIRLKIINETPAGNNLPLA